MSAFGDDTLLIEKFIEQARHIEVQVSGTAQTHTHICTHALTHGAAPGCMLRPRGTVYRLLGCVSAAKWS
jgi:hypothetical protein